MKNKNNQDPKSAAESWVKKLPKRIYFGMVRIDYNTASTPNDLVLKYAEGAAGEGGLIKLQYHLSRYYDNNNDFIKSAYWAKKVITNQIDQVKDKNNHEDMARYDAELYYQSAMVFNLMLYYYEGRPQYPTNQNPTQLNPCYVLGHYYENLLTKEFIKDTEETYKRFQKSKFYSKYQDYKSENPSNISKKEFLFYFKNKIENKLLDNKGKIFSLGMIKKTCTPKNITFFRECLKDLNNKTDQKTVGSMFKTVKEQIVKIQQTKKDSNRDPDVQILYNEAFLDLKSYELLQFSDEDLGLDKKNNSYETSIQNQNQ